MTDNLDGLLKAWADRQRLDDAAAATMLRSILDTPTPALAPATGLDFDPDIAPATDPAGLPPTWWADFGSRFSDAMLRATGVLVPTAA